MTRPLLSAVLIVAILAGQLAAACHEVDHLAAPVDQACAQCLHQPVQKHGLPNGSIELCCATSHSFVEHHARYEVHAEPRLPWSARAPPAASC